MHNGQSPIIIHWPFIGTRDRDNQRSAWVAKKRLVVAKVNLVQW